MALTWQCCLTDQAEGIEMRCQTRQQGRGAHEPDHEGSWKDAICKVAEIELALHVKQSWICISRESSSCLVSHQAMPRVASNLAIGFHPSWDSKDYLALYWG